MRTFNDSISVTEGTVQGTWDHTLSNGSETSLLVYYDRYKREDEGVHETLGTLNFDFQHHLHASAAHDVVWGAGYRYTADEHLPGYGKSYMPLNQATQLLSAFVQDEVRIHRSLSLTVGSKFEHQPFTGFQAAPSAQLVWTPGSRQTVWFSASQAIKEVSREDLGLTIDAYTFPTPGGGFGLGKIVGNPNTRPERLRDYEAGYRNQLGKTLSVDVTAFSSHYHNLETIEPGAPYFSVDPGPPHLVLPMIFANAASAHTYGIELSANWNATSRWRISPGYSGIVLNLKLDPGSRDTNEADRMRSTPENQVHVRSLVNLKRNLEWDSSVSYVGRLRDGGYGPVPAYTRVDTRLGWRVGESMECSVVGQNLLTPRHGEFHNAYEVNHTLVERSVLAKVVWRF